MYLCAHPVGFPLNSLTCLSPLERADLISRTREDRCVLETHKGIEELNYMKHEEKAVFSLLYFPFLHHPIPQLILHTIKPNNS